MFEICNDKTYFLAETTAKNKTIEITLVKDSHGGEQENPRGVCCGSSCTALLR